jgi:hypothetical protein
MPPLPSSSIIVYRPTEMFLLAGVFLDFWTVFVREMEI